MEQELIKILNDKKLFISTAESCTGGLLSASLTSVPGASSCFGLGVTTYSNEAKMQLLQVKKEILDLYGAVSHETALAMAKGLTSLSGADITVSVTGIAGPGGEMPGKPVGLVYIGLCYQGKCWSQKNLFSGDRQQVRKATIIACYEMLKRFVTDYLTA